MIDVLIKRGDTGAQEEMPCNDEAEIEGLQLQTKECPGLAANYRKPGRSKEGFSLTDFRGGIPLRP